ncbi:MAG: DNA mismatch repair endonuclease MutL [Firmicutes bacterium]|nr:DNA mismatch repair endonuclease MutL [Bacillota bacterium]
MNCIIRLHEDTANKIAAGEVVERPASVVKELVENALDAGATRIDVEIREGGKEYLRIVDNGRGIPEAEVPLAFERHATSKIRSADDLFRIVTLGFRGEALPSIAAVSELEMITKTKEAAVGTLIAFSGGKRVRLEAVGAPSGTAVTVRRLFFNTPARYKFLKQAATERRYIFDILGRLALANPRVRFRLISDEDEILLTPGDGKMEAVMWSIYGSRVGKSLVPIQRESNYFTITGLVSKPDVHRGNRQAETFIVNGRVVESSLLASAIEKGYQTLLPRRRFPIAAIFLTMEPSRLDVNVHPAKREIRFSDNSEIYRQVMLAVRRGLESSMSFASWSMGSAPQQDIPATVDQTQFSHIPAGAKPYHTEHRMIPPLDSKHRLDSNAAQHTPGWEAAAPTVEPMTVNEAAAVEQTGYQILGQFHKTYMLIEAEEELWLVDQHAAHERILYERFQKQLNARSIQAQALLVPLHPELGSTSTAAILEWAPKLAALGFEIAEFGSKDCLVRTVPAELSGIAEEELEELLLEIIRVGHTGDYREAAVVVMSCKGAVKAGEQLSLPVMLQLFTDLMTTQNSFTCPHGRPIVVRLALADIHRRFGRL